MIKIKFLQDYLYYKKDEEHNIPTSFASKLIQDKIAIKVD